MIGMRESIIVLFLGAVLMINFEGSYAADEVPAFFLKIAKNIPRVGRSDDYENYFYKTSKNIPRIGRNDRVAGPTPHNGEYLDHFAQRVKRRMDYYPNVGETSSWQHFPLAIEGPKELWRTLAGYSNDHSDDIDNEIWPRNKRSVNEEEY